MDREKNERQGGELRISQIGKQWKVVPLPSFSQIALRAIFSICLLGQHPQSPLNGIFDPGYSFILNAQEIHLIKD